MNSEFHAVVVFIIMLSFAITTRMLLRKEITKKKDRLTMQAIGMSLVVMITVFSSYFTKQPLTLLQIAIIAAGMFAALEALWKRGSTDSNK